MSSPQLENGHIRIANDLFRAIRMAEIKDVPRRVLLECFDRWYGWCSTTRDPEPFEASGADLALALSCSRSSANAALRLLVSKRMLRVVKKPSERNSAPGVYALNKDYDQWRCGWFRHPSEVVWTPKGGTRDPLSAAQDAPRPAERTARPADRTPPVRPTGGAPSGRPDGSGHKTSMNPAGSTALEPRENQVEKIPPKPPRGRRVSASDKADYVAHFRAEWERWTGSPSRMEDSTIYGVAEKALKKHGLEKCKLVLSWAFQAPDAGWHRGEGKSDKVYLKGSTLWRPSNFPGYLAEAESWAAGESSSAEFPPNDSLPLPQVADAFVDFHKGLKVMREPSGMWLPDSRKMLDPNLPWRAVLRDVMAGILRRRDAGERVDKYVPEPFLAALRDCSHPARPEQQIHLSNILGRLVDEIEGAQ